MSLAMRVLRSPAPRFLVAGMLALLTTGAGAQDEPLVLETVDAGPADLAEPPAPGHGNDLAEGDANLPPYRETGDLEALRKRGVLRVLDEGAEESFLPHEGRATTHDRELIREFARRRGLRVQFVTAGSFDQLFSMLRDGRGDVIANDLTVTKARKDLVAFTRPTAIASEIVVGRKGGPMPKSLAEIDEIHIRPGTSYEETLAALIAGKKLKLKIVPVPADLDPEELVYEVTRGTRPYTVIDSHLLKSIQGYNDQVVPLFPIAEGRPIAWAVRRENPELCAAIDTFLVEKAMTAHADERSVADLDFMKTRGSIRVLTRSNPVTYFLHRGQRFGFDYELAGLAAKALGLRLEMVVVPSRDQLIPWLLAGRGDVIAASFTRTPEREAEVAFTRPYLLVDEVLVQRRRKGPKARTLAELKGRKVHVRLSSSYHATLLALQKQVEFTIVPVGEDVETEEILEDLATGKIDFTVADSHILQVELAYRTTIEAAFTLPSSGGTPVAGGESAEAREVAFAVRKESPALKEYLDDFVRRTYRGLAYNIAKNRYFENKRSITIAKEQASNTGEISPFDPVIKKHSKTYGFDWRLMAAQAFQESRFDPKAKSWVGAQGLFQVMPATGKSMGYTDLENPEIGTHAGIRYMSMLVQQLDPKISLKQRMRFALASYNVGLGHVLDARRLATEQGLDPNKWFGHVEKAMLLLQKPRYAARARHGYCRGEEPVKYVSEIQNRYDNYVKVVPN